MSEARKTTTTTAFTPEPGMRTDNDTSVGGLLRQLTHEVPSLVTKELALAKAELSESIRATKAGAASVATGGAVVVIGLIMVSAGKKKFEASSFKPERTLHSMHKDKEAVRGHTS